MVKKNYIGRHHWRYTSSSRKITEHFAIFPEDLISKIVNFASQKGDWVLDPFSGRGTTGIVSGLLGRNFTGIDLYEENVKKTKKNISDAISGKISLKLQDQIVATQTENIPSLEVYLNPN